MRPDAQCESQTSRAHPLHSPIGLSHGYDRAMCLPCRDVCRRPPSWRRSRLGKPCPSGMQRDTPGLTGAVARCGAGTVRGTSAVALLACRGLRLHRCPSSAVLFAGHGTGRAARRTGGHACGCTTSAQPRPWHLPRAACARHTVGLHRGRTDVTHRALRVACAARTVANGGGVSNGQGSQGRARGARVPWRLAGGARHAASGCAAEGVDAQATG